VNQRAQVSLEYILIALSTVIVLSLIVFQATTLYSRNIKQIDNRELKDTYEKIQNDLDIIELTSNYYNEIVVYPQTSWTFKKINNLEYKLYNKEKEYLIKTSESINLKIKKINTESIIIIKKENKKISIELKT
jgi:uncharacterized protein (UPF0333 family)